MKDIRIGAVTCQCEAGNIEKNMNILHEWVCTAQQKKVAVLCFPELNITGYSIKKQILSSSFHLSDPRIQKISNIAIDNHMIILAGFLEHSSNQTAFASHLAAFPDGLVRVYRKIHVAPPEKHMIIPGNSIPVFHYQQITFGIQLCYDAHFPEVSTAMALQGADIIFIPHASPHGSPEKKVRSWMRHLSARAFDNGLFIVACNQSGENGDGLTFPSLCLVIGPTGEILEKKHSCGNDMVVADLKFNDIETVREHRMKYFLPHRRPDIYRQILT
jgi:N-carbamoylputrescine amidase